MSDPIAVGAYVLIRTGRTTTESGLILNESATVESMGAEGGECVGFGVGDSVLYNEGAVIDTGTPHLIAVHYNDILAVLP